MSDSLSGTGRGYETIQGTTGTSYRLPPRRLLAAGAVVGVIGVCLIGLAGLWNRGLFTSQTGSGGDVIAGAITVLRIIVGVLRMIPGVIGLGLLGVALVLVLGRNQVWVDQGQLVTVDYLGPLRWTRRRKTDRIATIEVNTMTTSTNGGPKKPVEGFASLLARPIDTKSESDKAKPFLAVWGYPRAAMQALAHDLADACEASVDAEGKLVENDRPAIAVTEKLGNDDDLEGPDNPADAVPDQPADSTAVVNAHDQGLTITIPPTGIWEGSKGLFVFALAWNGFMAVFTTFGVYGVIFGNTGGRGDDVPLLLVIPFVSVFWAVGIGMMVAAINMGRRRAILDVVGFPPDATLLVTRQTIFGTKQHDWPADQLDAIRFGPSGTEVNNKPVNELQIHPKDGKKLGLLSQRDDEELRWLAATLRVATGVGKG